MSSLHILLKNKPTVCYVDIDYTFHDPSCHEFDVRNVIYVENNKRGLYTSILQDLCCCSSI